MARKGSSSVSSGCSSRVESSVDISSMWAPAIPAVTAPVDLLSHDINSAEYEYYDGGGEVQDWCGICGRYEICACPMPQQPPIREPPPVCPGIPPKKAPPPSKELSPRTRSVLVLPKTPPPPPKWMATGACQCYLCKKPITVVEPAVKNRRIMVVEPGDLNYATDGVPWSVCSRCGVFRPFANATEECCLNVIGIECTYGESDGEAQQQEPARCST